MAKKLQAKNNKPEEIFKREIISYLIRNGFDVDVVESKAVYSQRLKRYLHSQATPGMSDLVGNDMNGHACFIELKAPKKLKTLRENQKLFLKKKVESNAFACVVDSLERFVMIYNDWRDYKARSDYEARQFLLNMIP